MGHPLRPEDREAIYHAIARGNNRGRIVWNTQDRASLAGELARAATKHRWEVFAWCLMSTHYHVVLRTPHGGLSAGFQAINGNHARRTNRRHGRVGHLFENRFWSDEIATEAHLVASILYVARNPIEARLCSEAGMWPDSSYRATAGLTAAPSWLALDVVHPLFGDERRSAQVQYAQSVHFGHPPVSDTIQRVKLVEPWDLEESEGGLVVARAA